MIMKSREKIGSPENCGERQGIDLRRKLFSTRNRAQHTGSKTGRRLPSGLKEQGLKVLNLACTNKRFALKQEEKHG